MQKHSYYLCKYFAKQQIQVDLFHFNQSNYDITKLEFFTDEERKFINGVVVPFPNSAKGFGHYLKNSYKYSQNIYEAIKENLNKYDFIYTKGFSGWYLIEQKHKLNLKIPAVGVKFHGYEMFQKAPDFKAKIQQILLLRKPVKEISQKADVVFSYGGKITDIIKSIGVASSKIVELPSGVEESILVNTINATGTKIKFLFLGRYERRKGIEELNQALLKLTENNFEFHFVGPIPGEKQLSLKNIIYHGEIRDKQKLNMLIKTCDVLVCPSWSEGMPNVILEAMANGLAVIATNVGATNVLVNDSNGWLINNCAPNQIEVALKKVIQSSPLDVDLKKQNALNQIKENFTWEKLIQKLIIKIKEVVS
jgi:glycosyltransferase involved in cell wall biosynthesis